MEHVLIFLLQYIIEYYLCPFDVNFCTVVHTVLKVPFILYICIYNTIFSTFMYLDY